MLAGPIRSAPKQLLNYTWTFKVRIYMYCYTCGKEYTSWAGRIGLSQTKGIYIMGRIGLSQVKGIYIMGRIGLSQTKGIYIMGRKDWPITNERNIHHGQDWPITSERNIHHGQDWPITNERNIHHGQEGLAYHKRKEYTSWSGLVYHKRTVHNCTKAFPGLYKCNIKSATKLTEERASECKVCPKRFRKGPMEDHYRKKHKENFTWIKCKVGCSGRREETFKDHIRWHNIYSKNEYYMKPEKLEDLLTTEYYDVYW